MAERQSGADAGQARIDRITASIRREPEPVVRRSIRRDPPPRPPDLSPTADPQLRRLAEELDYARRRLEALGEAIAGDIHLVMRHSVTLQTLDVVGQTLGHLATVVRAEDRAEAVRRIGMSELRERLSPPPL